MLQEEISLLDKLLKKAKAVLTTEEGRGPQFVSVHSGELEGESFNINSGEIHTHRLDDQGKVVLDHSLIY